MKYFFLCLPFFLAACGDVPPGAYTNRGGPESLLDVSSEAVHVPLSDPQGLEELTSWVSQAQPARAVVTCAGDDAACRHAEKALREFNVPFKRELGPVSRVVLHYERVMARDCENRFIDKPSNPHNVNSPSFGCSIAVNTVQQVTDKRQLVDPKRLDNADGGKAAQVYRRYRAAPLENSGSEESGYLLDKVKSQQ